MKCLLQQPANGYDPSNTFPISAEKFWRNESMKNYASTCITAKRGPLYPTFLGTSQTCDATGTLSLFPWQWQPLKSLYEFVNASSPAPLVSASNSSFDNGGGDFGSISSSSDELSSSSIIRGGCAAEDPNRCKERSSSSSSSSSISSESVSERWEIWSGGGERLRSADICCCDTGARWLWKLTRRAVEGTGSSSSTSSSSSIWRRVSMAWPLDGACGIVCTRTSAIRSLILSSVTAWPRRNRRFLSGRSAASWSLHLAVCASFRASVADMIIHSMCSASR